MSKTASVNAPMIDGTRGRQRFYPHPLKVFTKILFEFFFLLIITLCTLFSFEVISQNYYYSDDKWAEDPWL